MGRERGGGRFFKRETGERKLRFFFSPSPARSVKPSYVCVFVCVCPFRSFSLFHVASDGLNYVELDWVTMPNEHHVRSSKP